MSDSENRRETGYYPFEREGLGGAVLRRTYIGTGSGSGGRGVEGQESQMHEAHRLPVRGMIHGACNHHDDGTDINNRTISFYYKEF